MKKLYCTLMVNYFWTGILCGHGLTVVGVMNTKAFRTHYFLKRWTREAHNESIQDKEEKYMVQNPKAQLQ
jgi:zinc finger SWIM domain-containing protein 3